MIIIPPEIFRILSAALLSRPRPVEVAKDRLRAIIATDRAAVPCGRWVKDFRHRIATDDATGSWRVAKFDKRPHYRYEVRR